MAAFFLSGLLVSLLGALLPAWRYHIDPDYPLIGSYFLLQNVGLILGLSFAQKILAKWSLRTGLLSGCVIAVGGFILLAWFSPPGLVAGRMAGLFLSGAGAGLINVAAFHAIVPAFELDAAATLTLAGAIFSLGGLVTALVVSGAFFVYTVPSILMLLALVPAFAIGFCWKLRLPSGPDLRRPTWSEVVQDFRSPVAILFALMLFFEAGNEGALAAWLPLYLTQKLGFSPDTSLSVLALYWLTIMLGRIVMRPLLRRARQGRILRWSVAAAVFGCLILSSTNNMFGVVTGVLFSGLAFALIIPLVSAQIGDRFPYYHPGFFNGIFSVALTGALLAPASLGPLAGWFGIQVVMGLPLMGSVMVAILLVLITLEAKLSARPASSAVPIDDDL